MAPDTGTDRIGAESQEQAEDVRLLMVETMQTAPDGFVAPMVVEAKIAANWGDAKWRRHHWTVQPLSVDHNFNKSDNYTN